MAYADDINLIGDDIRRKERNADVLLLNACKDIGLAVTGKTNNMEVLVGRHRSMMGNEHIAVD